jgi:hypothetical protein
MTEHPLTDEICKRIQDSIHPCDPENIRAAADWQLVQLFERLVEEGATKGELLAAINQLEDNQ